MAQLPSQITIEKFSSTDLSELREELLQSGLDSRQCAELIRSFLTGRGYGASFDEASKAASSSMVLFGSLQGMQETLEKVAILM